jgi:hypothetical protein
MAERPRKKTTKKTSASSSSSAGRAKRSARGGAEAPTGRGRSKHAPAEEAEGRTAPRKQAVSAAGEGDAAGRENGSARHELVPRPQARDARRSRAATRPAPSLASKTSAAAARELAASPHSGKYVYCIIQSTERCSFGQVGIGAEPTQVYTIGYEDIAAVVSDTPLEVYDPTRENVLSHEHVNETVMHDHTVIPMSFGTVFKTADDIVELLRSAYSAFRDVLQKMENKLEFGLKVLWEPDEIIAVVEKEDESLRRLREEILKQRGSTYFARMQYERLVDSLLQERSETFVNEIFESLRPVSVATRVNKPIGERMIMNAAFLVSRDDEPAFDAEVKRIGARHPHLTFKYTGPWPPYNFVNIRLKLERAQESE